MDERFRDVMVRIEDVYRVCEQTDPRLFSVHDRPWGRLVWRSIMPGWQNVDGAPAALVAVDLRRHEWDNLATLVGFVYVHQVQVATFNTAPGEVIRYRAESGELRLFVDRTMGLSNVVWGATLGRRYAMAMRMDADLVFAEDVCEVADVPAGLVRLVHAFAAGKERA